MIPFATEFPVSIFTKGEFVALAVTWLKGSNHSTLFQSNATAELDRENASISVESGESLKLQDFIDEQEGEAFGLRYEIPDDQGRMWRTEFVLYRKSKTWKHSILRVRTQCLAIRAGATIDVPKKPYIVKTLLSEGKSEVDGFIEVSDRPMYLEETDSHLELAARVIGCEATDFLPVVYISSEIGGKHSLSKSQIEKLAFDLGGVAHILVEPSRKFGLKLRDLTKRGNAYGGSVGVYVPNMNRGRKFYIGGSIKDKSDLFSWVLNYCISVRSNLPSKTWDWTELQERAFKSQREKRRRELSSAETEQLYLQEIDALQDQVSDLKARLEVVSEDHSQETTVDRWSQSDLLGNIAEIYPGELGDRVQYLISIALKYSDSYGLDARTKAVGEKILGQNKPSASLKSLKSEIGQATKDRNKISKELPNVLREVGYTQKSDNKHIRLEPREDLVGLEPITVPKTPSDGRGLRNQKSQVENTLGLSKLKW